MYFKDSTMFDISLIVKNVLGAYKDLWDKTTPLGRTVLSPLLAIVFVVSFVFGCISEIAALLRDVTPQIISLVLVKFGSKLVKAPLNDQAPE